MMNAFPRILIFNQSFNSYSGGGITLSNLFKGWPKERIAVLSYPYMLTDITHDICENYYQIGQHEYKWLFPFSLFKQIYPSGVINGHKIKSGYMIRAKPGIKHFASTYVVNPILEWLGLHHCISTIHISATLKEWLSEFRPDILYVQVSNLESISFSIKMIDFLKIPSVIHMMDDWPSTISTYGPLKKYWQKRIEREFMVLLDKVDLYLSISDSMSEEYLKRYQKVFKAFHNPVDIQKFNGSVNNNCSNTGVFRILYIGRIGTANKHTIIQFTNHISKYNPEKTEIWFDIFSKDSGIPELNEIRHLKNVTIGPPVSHEMIQEMMKTYDLLLLPLDFTEEGTKFSRFSIPTKVSEYMLSGTPILVFAPAETAVSQFFSKHNCGSCVTSLDKGELNIALSKLISNIEYRNIISNRALDLAKENFDGNKVRQEFHGLLKATAKTAHS